METVWIVVGLVVAAFVLIVVDARRGATRRQRVGSGTGGAQGSPSNARPGHTSSGRITPKHTPPGRGAARARSARARKPR